jgi:hypothetical protein
MNIVSWANSFIAIAGIGLDRLPKQRSALHKPGISSGFPPQRGGFRSLSVGAVCFATEITNYFPHVYPRPDKLLDTAAHG